MQQDPSGKVLANYHAKRVSITPIHFRMRRRSHEAAVALKRFGVRSGALLLDVGTADGLAIDALGRSDGYRGIGIDVDLDMLRSNPQRAFMPIRADGLSLPFCDGTFDAVIATAVVEHVDCPSKLVGECGRVLRRKGILVLTAPDPRFDKVASFFSSRTREIHQAGLDCNALRELLDANQFRVVALQKFMLSPCGFLVERYVERVLRSLGLGCLLLNQLAVGERK